MGVINLWHLCHTEVYINISFCRFKKNGCCSLYFFVKNDRTELIFDEQFLILCVIPRWLNW